MKRRRKKKERSRSRSRKYKIKEQGVVQEDKEKWKKE